MPDGCKFSADEVVSDGDPRLSDGASGCEFEEGATILLVAEEPDAPSLQDEAAPEASPPPAETKGEGESMPAPAERTSKAKPAEVVAVQEDAAAGPDEELQASVEMPDSVPTADDIAKAASAAGDNPMLAIGLAALVVIGGGGAMWKFIQQKGKATSELEQKRAEQEHELKMRELDLRASQSSGPDYSTTQPPPCQATSLRQEQAIVSVGGRVSSVQEELEQLKSRIAKLEKKSASFSADFDADEMRELVEKHEREIKALKAPKRTR